jgi:hypothetical protein
VTRAGLVAAVGLVWSTASYFVGRSHAAQVIVLAPMFAAGLLVALRTPALASTVVPRQVIAAVLAALLVGPLGFGLGWYNFAHRVPDPARIDAVRPRVDASLQALIDQAGLRAGEPVAYVGNEPLSALMPVWRDAAGRQVTESPLWLPLAPVSQLALLPSDRRLVYLDRFSRSWPDGGWLVEANDPDVDVSWLHTWLSDRYAVAGTFSGQGWRLTRYEHR